MVHADLCCPFQLSESNVTAQTQQALEKLDAILEQAGTSKSRILETRIWLKDIERDFGAMNQVYKSWIDRENKAVRHCVQAALAFPAMLVEIQVVAALP